MPLPPSAIPRKLKHTRQITVDGYAREDGLWDIEARITDRKTRELRLANGTRPPGAALHDMSIRLTIDTQMNVIDVETVSDATPYPGICDAIAPTYRALIGLNLRQRFRQSVRELVGGTAGCTHITELTDVLPTAAVQSFAGEVVKVDGSGESKPFALDRCHALRTEGEAVRLYYPKWYQAAASEPEAEPSEAADQTGN